jgi:hypothetical protein
MERVRLGIAIGTIGAVCALGACALDESGTFSDGGAGPDVIIGPDGGPDVTQQDVTQEDVSYDVPDLGVGETEAGLPCTCVSSVPSGYTIVEYVPNQRPACSTGYGSQKDYVENPTAAASTCSCTCGATPTQAPTCSCGNPATFNISSGHGNCTDVKNESLQAATNCYKTAQSLNPGSQQLDDMLAAPASACTASGGACANPTKVQTIPAPTSDQGRVCNLSASTSTCSNNGICIPTQASPYGLCVTNFTMDACSDPNFPVTHVVGTGISDTRTCGPSACTSCTVTNTGTCGTPQLTLYPPNENNCGGTSSITLPADNSTCTAVGLGNGATFGSAKYSVSQSGGTCGYTGTFTPQGALSVTGAFNVCCHP